MPKGFSEQEQRNIEARLLSEGKKAFGRWGIKKTSVEELATAAGISKGAFYRFFQSKEDLYFAIIRNYENLQHQRMFEILSAETSDDRELFRNLIKEIIEQIDNDDFFKRLLLKKDMEYLYGKLSREQLDEALEADNDFATSLTNIWKEKGKLLVDDPELIAGILRSVFFLFLHKEDIGENKFNEVVDFFIEMSIDRLIAE